MPQHHVVTSPQQLQQLNSEKVGRAFACLYVLEELVLSAVLLCWFANIVVNSCEHSCIAACCLLKPPPLQPSMGYFINFLVTRCVTEQNGIQHPPNVTKLANQTSIMHMIRVPRVIVCFLPLLFSQPQALGAGRRFVLKSIAYDSVHRADLMLLPCSAAKLAAYLARPDISITQQCPWILQEYIQVGAAAAAIACFALAQSSSTAAALAVQAGFGSGAAALLCWVDAAHSSSTWISEA